MYPDHGRRMACRQRYVAYAEKAIVISESTCICRLANVSKPEEIVMFSVCRGVADAKRRGDASAIAVCNARNVVVKSKYECSAAISSNGIALSEASIRPASSARSKNGIPISECI